MAIRPSALIDVHVSGGTPPPPKKPAGGSYWNAGACASAVWAPRTTRKARRSSRRGSRLMRSTPNGTRPPLPRGGGGMPETRREVVGQPPNPLRPSVSSARPGPSRNPSAPRIVPSIRRDRPEPLLLETFAEPGRSGDPHVGQQVGGPHRPAFPHGAPRHPEEPSRAAFLARGER